MQRRGEAINKEAEDEHQETETEVETVAPSKPPVDQHEAAHSKEPRKG